LGVEARYDKYEVPVVVESGTDHYEYSQASAELVLQTVFSSKLALGIGIGYDANVFNSIDREPSFDFVSIDF